MQEIADRRPAIFGSAEARHIGLGRVVDRFDRAFGNRDADQQAGDRLDHRLGNKPVAVGPAVLVMLEQDLVVLGDQETGDGIAREVAGHFSPKRIGQFRRRALERPRYGGALHLPRRIDVIDMGERADAIAWLPRIALPSGLYGIGDRISCRGAVELGVGTGGGEDRPRLLRRCTAHWRCKPATQVAAAKPVSAARRERTLFAATSDAPSAGRPCERRDP